MANAVDPSNAPVRRRRVRRIVLASLGGVALLLLVVVALAPTIGSSIAPGIASRAITDRINGRANVTRTSLSWTGGQEIGPVEIVDANGKLVATATLTLSKGLLSLTKAALIGPMDLGEVRVGGEANVVREPDGRLNVEKLPKAQPAAQPAPGGGGGGGGGAGQPAKLPPGLRARLVIEAVDVTYTDQSPGAAVPTVKIPKVAGTASIDNGKVDADVGAGVFYATAGSPQASQPGGQFSVKASATNLTDAAGVLTLDKATIDATADLSDLAVQAADALAGMKGGLVEALGERVRATIAAKGNAGRADLTAKVQSAGLNADVALLADNGVLSAPRPGVIEAKTEGARRLLGVDAALAPSGLVTLQTLPDVRITLDALKLTLPFDPANLKPRPLDLRGSSVAAAVETTGLGGTLRVPNPDGTPGAPQPFAVAPLSMRVESPDLADRVTVKGGTSATLGGQPAGQFLVDVSAEGPLDEKGQPRATGPRVVRGQVTLAQLATAIAQPFVEASGLDLARGVGPTLDVRLTAQTSGAAPAQPGQVPPTDLDVAINSANVSGGLALALDSQGLRSRDDKGGFAVRSTQALLGRAMAKSGVEMLEGGPLTLAVREVRLPMEGTPEQRVAQTAVDAAVTIGGLTLRPIAPPGQPATDVVRIETFRMGMTTASGKVPTVAVNGSGAAQNQPFSVNGGFQLSGLKPVLAGNAPAYSVRPVGQLVLENLPTSLMSVAMPPKPPAAAQPGQPAPRPPLDVARLVRDAVGPALNLQLTSAARPNSPEGVDVTLAARAANLTADLAAGLDPRSIALSRLEARTAITPELAGTLLDSMGPRLEARPQLAAPAAIVVTAQPVTVPLGEGFKPDFAKAGDLNARLEIAGKTLLTNVVTRDEQGRPRDLGPMGVENVLATASLPLRTLAPGAAPAPAKVELRAGVLGDAQTRIVDLNAGGVMNLAGGQPSGDLDANLDLTVTNTARLDQILAQPGLLSGGVGEGLRVKADAKVAFPPPAGPGAAPAPPIRSALVNASIDSPLLKTTQPLRLVGDGQTLSLDKPASLSWRISPDWATRYLLGVTGPGPQGAPPPLAFAKPTLLAVDLGSLRLAMPRTPAEGPLKPGVFAADARVTASEAGLIVSGTPADVRGFVLRLVGGKEPGQLAVRLAIDDLGQGKGDNNQPAVDFRGTLVNVADQAGRPSFDLARLNLEGRAQRIPTALVDAIAKQGGVLYEALGPTAALNVTTRDFSARGGSLALSAESPRATMEVKGRIQEGVFLTEGPLTARLLEVSPELGARLAQSLPQIATIEKRPEDGPAVVQTSGLTLPIDGDMSKLNGQVRFELGAARFTTSDVFGKLLKFVGGRAAGQVGQRIEPFTVNFARGVAAYERFTLPLGEFRLQTQGTVDLVRKQVDVVTYVPFGALSDETAALFKVPGSIPVLGQVIESTTMVPLHTTGGFGKTQTRPDLELFARETGRNLKEAPGKVAEDLLKGIFRRDEGKK